jgi:hypothetical protein
MRAADKATTRDERFRMKKVVGSVLRNFFPLATAVYVFLSVVGMAYHWRLLCLFDVNICHYATDASDYFAATFRSPKWLLLFLLWLATLGVAVLTCRAVVTGFKANLATAKGCLFWKNLGTVIIACLVFVVLVLANVKIWHWGWRPGEVACKIRDPLSDYANVSVVTNAHCHPADTTLTGQRLITTVKDYYFFYDCQDSLVRVLPASAILGITRDLRTAATSSKDAYRCLDCPHE